MLKIIIKKHIFFFRCFLFLLNVLNVKRNFMQVKFYTQKIYSLNLGKNLNTKQKSVAFASLGQIKNSQKAAEEFAMDLYEASKKGKLDKNTITGIARKTIPFIEIGSMRELYAIFGEDALKYKAYLLPEYGQDCKIKKLTIFSNDKASKIQQIGSLSHEYCHGAQRYNDNNYMGLSNYTNGNLYQARALNSIAACVFSSVENLKRTKGVLENTLKNLNDSKTEQEALYKAFNLKDEYEFKIFIKRYFNQIYPEILKSFTSRKEIKKNIPFCDNPIKLRKIIKEQCATRARMEYEAYSVQKNVIQKINKEELSMDNIFNPIFYKALCNVFN